MSAIISLCGDDCERCPRYLAKTDEELSRIAELWYRVGWRERILPPNEMRCVGCAPDKPCGYGLTDCTRANGVSKCGECTRFPCEKTADLLARSKDLEAVCKARCTDEEFDTLSDAFFHKEDNLGL